MSNNKQSSVVDWIFSQLPDEYTTTRSGFDVYQQAKAMHKEEIKNAFTNGFISSRGSNRIADEIFYNETFGGNNE